MLSLIRERRIGESDSVPLDISPNIAHRFIEVTTRVGLCKTNLWHGSPPLIGHGRSPLLVLGSEVTLLRRWPLATSIGPLRWTDRARFALGPASPGSAGACVALRRLLSM